jgi:hypothetical protein
MVSVNSVPSDENHLTTKSGTDAMIFKIFSPKKIGEKIGVFDSQQRAKLCKYLIITLVFEKNADLFAKNCRKSQKIVIITSTPDCFEGARSQ